MQAHCKRRQGRLVEKCLNHASALPNKASEWNRGKLAVACLSYASALPKKAAAALHFHGFLGGAAPSCNPSPALLYAKRSPALSYTSALAPIPYLCNTGHLCFKRLAWGTCSNGIRDGVAGQVAYEAQRPWQSLGVRPPKIDAGELQRAKWRKRRPWLLLPMIPRNDWTERRSFRGGMCSSICGIVWIHDGPGWTQDGPTMWMYGVYVDA
eukprot:804433-Pelagomonas_calceolata.AAC.2